RDSAEDLGTIAIELEVHRGAAGRVGADVRVRLELTAGKRCLAVRAAVVETRGGPQRVAARILRLDARRRVDLRLFESEQRRLADEAARLVGRDTRHVDGNAVRALLRDLRFGKTGFVHTAGVDLDRGVHRGAQILGVEARRWVCLHDRPRA